MRRVRSHLTYANVMVTILAFIVLGGGSALASYVVSSNGQVGPNTISGHNPPSGRHANVIPNSITGGDVKQSSLTQINAAKVNGGDLCRTHGVLTESISSPATTVCKEGGLTLTPHCESVGDSTEAWFDLETSVDHAFYSSYNSVVGESTNSDFLSSDAPGLIAESHDIDATPGPGASPVTSFYAGVGKAQLSGTAGTWTKATGFFAGSCKFVVSAVG